MLPKIEQAPYSERFAGRKPKIFIGLVAYGSIYPEVMTSWVLWSIGLGAKYADRFELYFGMASKREQYRARNYLIQEAQLAGADFLLMIDDDHTVSDCPDMLEHFFDLEKPIQTALSVQRGRGGDIRPTVLHVDDKGHCDFYRADEVPAEPCPVDASGGGCTWVDMWLFDFMSQPFWFPFPEAGERVTFIPEPRYGLDINFCIRARKLLGVETWLNTNVVLGHVINERDIVRPSASNRMTAADFEHREAFRPAYKQIGKAICDTFDFGTALDVGSGQGFLVDALLENGKDVMGVELERAAQMHMSKHAKPRILIGDATNGGCPRGRFDLVTCVEVAEHVPVEREQGLLDNIANKAGRYVYFTADQTPSRLHINLKPKGYWIDEFAKRGFALDIDRTKKIKEAIADTTAPWVRDNGMAFVRMYPEVRGNG
jgi:hypothetical protein